MTDVSEEPKAARGQPTLAYVEEPDSLSALIARRKQSNLSELQKLEKNIGVLKNAEQRL